MSDNQVEVQKANASQDIELKQIHSIPQRQNQNASLIEALKQTPNFLAQKYNEKLKAQNPSRPVRAGGVYVPPHKLRAMQEQLMKKDVNGMEHQKMMWQLLRKSINGIVNKVNISNIQNIVIELFNENILRGKGLLSKSIIKAQMASPNFTHVYAALIAVINTKLPQISNLIIKRVMIQFRRAFQRNNKIVCIATTKMIAHLINQRVLGEYAGLQLLFILLNQPTQASVEIACDFMVQAGQVLAQLTPAGANAIFERFKTLLHEAQISQKAQYSIESLFAIRKTGFKEHPGVIPELDLVEAQDQITHNMDFEDQLTAEQNLNVFKFDPFYQKTQQEWDSIKLEILGEQNIINLKRVHNYEQEMLQQQQRMEQQQKQEQIHDLTEQDLINLRRTIYLVIQSTLNFQECAHKLLKMNIAKGYQHELVDMIIQCCMMERIYQNFFGLLAQRFCSIDDLYKQLFIKAFINHYNAIFKLQVNKIRNLAKIFGHLLFRFAIDWTVFQVIVLKPQTTTAAGRMFLKILFKQISQNLGIDRMQQEFNKQQMRQYYEGLFPIDHPNNLRFSINYFTSIGLGKLTEGMRQVLAMQQEIIMNRRQKQEQQKIMQQLRQEEQMMKLMQQQQQKQREKLQIQNLQRQQKRKQQQKKFKQQKRLKAEQQRERLLKRKRDDQYRTGRRNETRKNQKRRQSSSSQSSSSSSSSGSSSSSSSNDSVDKKNKKQKANLNSNSRLIKQLPRADRVQERRKQKSPIKKRHPSSSSSKSKSAPVRKGQSQRNRQRSRERLKQDKSNLKKRRYSSSKSSSRSSSPQNHKIKKVVSAVKQPNVKLQIRQIPRSISKKGNEQKKKIYIQSSQQSESSGLSSSDDSQSSSDQSGQVSRKNQPNKRKIISKKNEKKRKRSESSSSSSSGSSSSGSSVDTNELYRRKLKKQGKI